MLSHRCHNCMVSHRCGSACAESSFDMLRPDSHKCHNGMAFLQCVFSCGLSKKTFVRTCNHKCHTDEVFLLCGLYGEHSGVLFVQMSSHRCHSLEASSSETCFRLALSKNFRNKPDVNFSYSPTSMSLQNRNMFFKNWLWLAYK